MIAVLSGMQSLLWLVILFVCIVIEIATLGLATIWFAGGALIAAVLALLHVPFAIQVVAFILVSFILLMFTRPVAVKYFNRNRIKTNAESLVGMQAIVVSEIDNLQQTGRVTIQGKEWTARTTQSGIQIQQGAIVIVRAIDGVKLIVEERKEEN